MLLYVVESLVHFTPVVRDVSRTVSVATQGGSCRGRLPFAAQLAVLACIGGLAFRTRTCAFGGFLL